MALKNQQNDDTDAGTATKATVTSRLKSAFSINTRMIMSKFAYILYGAIMGFHFPFIVIFLKSVGLTAAQAGFISGIRFITSAAAGPLWGMLADYTGRRTLILVVLCVGAVFPIGIMPWIAKWIHPTKLSDICHPPHNITVNISCTTKINDELHTLFWVYLLIALFGSAFVICIPGYIDSIVIKVVKRAGKRKASYGMQRVFASIGFSVAGFLGGLASDHYIHPGLSHYTAVFFMYIPSILLMIPVGAIVIRQAVWDDDKTPNDTTPNDTTDGGKKEKVTITWENSITRQVLLLFKKFDVSFFMTSVFLTGIANSLFLSFSFLLVKDTMHPTKTVMTLIVITGSLSEIFIFPFTSKLIKWFRGTSVCITLGIFTYFIRFLAVSYATAIWQMVLIQTLHCIGSALAWAAIMEHTHKIAPKEIAVTVFNIMTAIFFSLSAVVANMLGGYIYDEYGGRILFRAVAAVCGIWTLLMTLYYGGKNYKAKQLAKFDNTITYQGPAEGIGGITEKSAFEIGIANPVRVHDDDASLEMRLETN